MRTGRLVIVFLLTALTGAGAGAAEPDPMAARIAAQLQAPGRDKYDAAKDRQGIVRARLGALQARISELSAYSLSRLPRERVSYGSVVLCEDLESGDEVEFRVVFPEEVDGSEGQISIGSPIGRALLNHEVGDEVRVAVAVANGLGEDTVVANVVEERITLEQRHEPELRSAPLRRDPPVLDARLDDAQEAICKF